MIGSWSRSILGLFLDNHRHPLDNVRRVEERLQAVVGLIASLPRSATQTEKLQVSKHLLLLSIVGLSVRPLLCLQLAV